jgi:hypothetical protein
MSFPMAINRLSGQRIITIAAKHNLREIVAEIGADKHIDPKRSADNIILRGPVTADGVVALRKSLLDAAKLKKKLRVDAVQGLEVLFTWPFPGQECPLQYFEDCTRWAENHFNVPVLSSVVHLDESQPHCHVILLPLINGRMNGSDLFGTGVKLRMHLDSFYQLVGASYGITRPLPKPRLSAATRDFIIAQVASKLDAISGLTEETVRVLLEAHRRSPHALQEHFDVSLPKKPCEKTRSFVEIFTAKAKPESRRFPYGGAGNVQLA